MPGLLHRINEWRPFDVLVKKKKKKKKDLSPCLPRLWSSEHAYPDLAVQNSPFFKLPLELREEIYRFMCSGLSVSIREGDESYRVSKATWVNQSWIFLLAYSHPPGETYELQKWYQYRYRWSADSVPITCERRPCIAGWLASCRKAYMEVIGILFRSIDTLHIDVTSVPQLHRHLPPASLASLVSLDLVLKDSFVSIDLEHRKCKIWAHVLTTFPRLVKLYIAIEDDVNRCCGNPDTDQRIDHLLRGTDLIRWELFPGLKQFEIGVSFRTFEELLSCMERQVAQHLKLFFHGAPLEQDQKLENLQHFKADDSLLPNYRFQRILPGREVSENRTYLIRCGLPVDFHYWCCII